MICLKCGCRVNNGVKFCPTCGAEMTGENVKQEEVVVNNQKEKKGGTKSIVSLIFGILSIIGCVFFIIMLPLSIIGLILGAKEKEKNGMSIAGIILNIIGLLLNLAIAVVFCLATFFTFAVFDDVKEYIKENVNEVNGVANTYVGDGFTFKYDSDWTKAELAGGQKGIKYKEDTFVLIPVGKSSLSESNADFSNTTNRYKIYEAFYSYWNNNSNSGLKIQYGSDGFNLLVDDIYYATYDYGKSSNELRGKYYLVIAPEKNAVLSFMSNYEVSKMDYNEKIIDILKTIKIDNIPNPNKENNKNVIYDDELYDYLDSMSNWNRYSDLRSGQLGKIRDLTGGWRVLSNSEMYWEFKNNEFWWYKSINDKNDNYWYGTYEVVKGKAGLAKVGMDSNKVDDIIERSNNKITENDIYAVICDPSKIITGGVDKTDTNMTDETIMKYVWIIVDHGTEGFEGQVYNVLNADISYYFKIND